MRLLVLICLLCMVIYPIIQYSRNSSYVRCGCVEECGCGQCQCDLNKGKVCCEECDCVFVKSVKCCGK